MSIEMYLKCKYTSENAGFCILCIDDFKILKIFIKLSKFSTIFHRETSQAPTPQRPYDVSREQNRYVTLPLLENPPGAPIYLNILLLLDRKKDILNKSVS